MLLKVGCNKSSRATLPANVSSSKSLSPSKDCPSSHTSFSDGELAQNVRKGVKHRILYLSEQLRVEKASRDENTMSYLKLVSKAEGYQAQHIRQAFEKVNQHTSATIAQIERKLSQCHWQLQELEMGHRPKRSVLTEDSSLDKCGQPGRKASFSQSPKPSGQDGSSNMPTVARPSTLGSLSGLQQRKFLETKHAPHQRKMLLKKVKEELTEIREAHTGLEVSHQRFKERYHTDLQGTVESLQEKKCRQSLMEEQVNNHLQRHLDEFCHLKQNLASMEEKTAYLSYEKTKEIWEVMETFTSRISKLESLQQATQVEMMANRRSRPHDYLLRFVSMILTLTTILLVMLSTMCSFPLPLVNSRLRTCTLLMLIGLGSLAWQKWHTISIMD